MFELFKRFFSGKAKTEAVQSRVSFAIPDEPKESEYFRPYVRNAIRDLKLISPEFEDWVVGVVTASQRGEGRRADLVPRGGPDQMTADEKRAAGIRVNAMMTKPHYARLTEKGRSRPLDALDITVRHVTFAAHRHEELERARRRGVVQVKAMAPFPHCPGCAMLDKQPFAIDTVPSLPVEGCSQDVCAVRFQPIINFRSEDSSAS